MTKIQSITLMVIMVLTSLAFLAAGGAKLAGVEQMHLSFAAMGLPAWFGYFIGACEVCGAVGLWIRKLSFYAAAGLLGIMAGAVYFHVNYDAIANALPALMLGLFSVVIMVNRYRERLAS